LNGIFHGLKSIKNSKMNGIKNDEIFIKRCLQLAAKGRGKVAPNPMVGSVIVFNNEIIGEGYHRIYGGPHAEVNAINSVSNKSLLSNSTIYVSLEPCSHYGKTPPCSQLIIDSKIPKVVIGMQDPFSKVNGAGIKKLRDAGCDVRVGVLEEECVNLNNEFIVFHTQKRPYIILKWAETLDGFIDKERKPGAILEPNWITNEVCRALVHKWRTEIKAIMVGTNTAKMDNPQLNVRSWSGTAPIRIFIDRKLSLSKELNLYDNTIQTLVLNEKRNDVEGNTEYIKMIFKDDFIKDLMKVLYERNISSLFVEGGQELLNTFISNNYWDEARVFMGNKLFKKGVSAPKLSGEIISKEKLRDNYLSVIKRF